MLESRLERTTDAKQASIVVARLRKLGRGRELEKLSNILLMLRI